MVWIRQEDASIQTVANSPMTGTRRKYSPEERWINGERRNVTDNGVTEKVTIGIDGDMWRNKPTVQRTDP
jgi:hypothetical protein